MSDNNVQITSKGIKNSLKKYTSLIQVFLKPAARL